MPQYRWLATFLLSSVCLCGSADAGVPAFEAKVVDPNIGVVCYAVTSADVNGDGKLDIVAVSEDRVQWYEAPTWTKHVIIDNQTELDNVCIAATDIDGDGRVDFALGAGWIKSNTGSIQWITRGAKPDDKWSVHFIAKEVSTHRMSFADVLGKGKPQLVVSPLNRSVAPAGIRLMAFEIPAQPKTDRWGMTILDESLNRMHNHTHVDWNGDGKLDTITASQEGVFLIERKGEGFQKTKLGQGATGDKPETQGAGEIRVGKLKSGGRFLATVEPMHGTSIAVYTTKPDGSLPLQRNVIEETLKAGHAVWAMDLDGDGADEIVIGHREPGTGTVKGPGLYVYSCDDEANRKWSKHVIDDGGVAVEDALAADFNGDGKPDLVAGGRVTHNVKLYLNLGARK